MVRKMSIESENQEIENSMRNLAKKLISENEVDVVIGYTKGTVPLTYLLLLKMIHSKSRNG